MNFTKNIIGLTGLFCSGKSTVENILANDCGYFVIDVDKVGHLSLEHNKLELIKHFGESIIIDNKIDRKKLGSIVFSDKKEMDTLNRIVRPFMIDYVKKIVEESEQTKICISAAIIFELELHLLCKKIFVVKSSIFNIIKRAKKRNNYSIFKTLSILSNQKVLELAKKNKKNTEIIYVNNNSTIVELKNFINKNINN